MPGEQELLTLYEKAEKMYNMGKLNEAITEFGKILELAPKTPLTAKAANFIGEIYQDKLHDLKAADYYKKAIEIDPSFLKAYYNVGDVYYNLGNYNEALEQYRKVIDANPDLELKAKSLKSIGDVYYNLGNYNEALEQYRKVIDANPDLELKAECLMSIGDVCRDQEKYDDALIEYNKIILLDVDNTIKSKALQMSGVIYILKKDINQALTKFRDARELDNTLDDARLQLAKMTYSHKDTHEAIDEYKKIIESNPDSELASKAYFEMGIIYYEMEDFGNAENNYKEAIKFNPNSKVAAESFFNMGEMYREQKKYDDAIKNYKEALKIDPNLEDAHYYLADSLYNKKLHKEALLEIDEAIRINPKDASNHNLKGVIFWKKQYQKALEEFNKAIELDPTHYWAHLNLAVLYEDKKQNKKAVDEWINCLIYAEDYDQRDTKANNHLKKLGISENDIEKLKAKMQLLPPKIEENKTNPSIKNFENSNSKALENISDLSKKTFLPVDFLEKIKVLLEDKHQLIFYGVPGTGKTFVAKEFANYFANCATEEEVKNRVNLIQFHQSYSYEEFMEGIRPETLETSSGKKEINYSIHDGIFKKFCKKAKENSNEKFLLIIDEINRGNISKIFGELLYLLEYRNSKIILPYSGHEFDIPDNIYIIGTMNTADRSIALVDYALRRRFYFIEFLPDAEVLRKWMDENGNKKSDYALNYFIKLNEKIKTTLDEHHQIGHSYFMINDGTFDKNKLSLIWEYNIMPLLKEYFFTKTRNNLDEFHFDSLMKS